jgi:hypothetical protein
MSKAYAIVAGVLILASGNALAEDASDGTEAKNFYVVQNTSTKECMVAKSEPKDAKFVTIGDTSYATRKDARAAAKQAGCQLAKKKSSDAS